jgi:hypothetical protein
MEKARNSETLGPPVPFSSAPQAAIAMRLQQNTTIRINPNFLFIVPLLLFKKAAALSWRGLQRVDKIIEVNPFTRSPS